MPASSNPEAYGDRWAPIYDDIHGQLDPTAAVDRLAALAEGGRILELAIGTGRIALPLAARGLELHGIDASTAMVDRLRAKPGGAELPVTIGDFADVGVEGDFDLVFVAFNTLFALLTQEEQVRCFRNVAAHLASGGAFVIEAFVPDPTRWTDGQRVGASRVDDRSAMLEVSTHDPVRQVTTSQQVVLDEAGLRMFPVQVRYAWPTELDLMAQLAGLQLESRTAGWDGGTFEATSTGHVSVYRRPQRPESADQHRTLLDAYDFLRLAPQPLEVIAQPPLRGE